MSCSDFSIYVNLIDRGQRVYFGCLMAFFYSLNLPKCIFKLLKTKFHLLDCYALALFQSNSFKSISFHRSNRFIYFCKVIHRCMYWSVYFCYIKHTYLFDCRSIELIGNFIHCIRFRYTIRTTLCNCTIYLSFDRTVHFLSNASSVQCEHRFISWISVLKIHRYSIGRILKLHRFIHIPFHRSRPQVIFFSSPPSQMRAFLF